jgi:putative DNA primase/helicase
MNFYDHASAYGLIIRDLVADGKWHRVPTTDKPRKRNGAYVWDGQKGAVKNWATMLKAEAYREYGPRVLPIAPVKVDDSQKYVSAAKKAGQMISSAKMGKHPYLAKKGWPEKDGLVLDGQLLIPMRQFDGTLSSVQMISPEGEKKFLPGGKAKRAVFVLNRHKLPSVRWLVEGFATGLSVLEAVQAMYRQDEVWVCFSAGNLADVSGLIPGRRVVFADNDASKTGQKAAESTGLPWVMSPVEGEDANDYHQRAGLWGLVRLMRKII